MDWFLVATIVSLIAGLVSERLSRSSKRTLNQFRETLRQEQREIRNKMVHNILVSSDDVDELDFVLQEFGVSAPNEIADSEQYGFEKEMEDRTSALKERLENIEKRFPAESTLEKIASVNDAILGTRLEELQKSVERIESKLFSKWDVAKIVFLIIGSLGALVGLTFTTIEFVT